MDQSQLNLHDARQVQWYNGVPFQRINKIKEENGVVTFSTEWPVRELKCTSKEFSERFRKLS